VRIEKLKKDITGIERLRMSMISPSSASLLKKLFFCVGQLQASIMTVFTSLITSSSKTQFNSQSLTLIAILKLPIGWKTPDLYNQMHLHHNLLLQPILLKLIASTTKIVQCIYGKSLNVQIATWASEGSFSGGQLGDFPKNFLGGGQK